ncbi:tryptophan synthase beta subunit-like PLP-dependent enzyme [Aspergillus pseudodeflectus]|uniref:tryptophan synthase n=1 Tax=Aspergillus pseudodeflectus TaxID=176178 RepID=A0ABR4JS52_9EURO
MLVSVRSHQRSRQYPYALRWRKAKHDRHTLSRVPEEKTITPLIKSLNLDLGELLHTPLWSRHQISIPPVDAPSRFGQFGGQFAAELQMDILLDLPSVFHSILSDNTFWDDFTACPLIRPSPLHFAHNLTQAVGGANIWLKREDLNPFGSYQARNVVGQTLFAHRIGKTEIVMDCGFAGHGLVCAAMCARLKMKCTILMGTSDVSAQPDAIKKMEELGATVISAKCPGMTRGRDKGYHRTATNEALRYSLTHIDSAYHITSGTVGPHPLPSIARTFQSLLGQEIKNCISRLTGREDSAPDALISHVGSSGAAALGMFATFIDDPAVRLVGVEAADAAPLTHGSVGVMYGCKTLLLQDDDGQILETYSVAPDLNFPCAGPELAHWKDMARLETVTASNEEAVQGLRILCEHEGIVSSLATGHAVLQTVRLAKELGAGKDVVLLVSG